MDWNSDLVCRAEIVVKEAAFEIVDSEELGLRTIVVTDCIDENQKAVYLPKDGEPFEKFSTFKTEERRKEVEKLLKANWLSLMEVYNDYRKSG